MSAPAALVLILAAAWSGAAGPSSGRAQPRGAADDGFSWPVPDGWRKETIPFPLEFAPGLKHRGVEELRFGPGFSRPDAPDYWSYDFVWRLDDDSALDEKALAQELTAYFRGLNMTVGGKKYGFDAARFKATVEPAPAGGGAAFRARVESYDAFATGKPIVLNVEIAARTCADGRRRAVAFAISPSPADAPVWKALREEASAFECR